MTSPLQNTSRSCPTPAPCAGRSAPIASAPIASAAVTADGSPVAVYLAAPPGDTAQVVTSVAPPPASVLELGAGAGRETRPLVACGYDVTAVDDDREMLAHVTGARTVRADLFTLDVGHRFDVVLAGSHFIDDADPARRSALLAACARHVAAAGVVLVERHDPVVAGDPSSFDGWMGPVAVAFEVLDHDAGDATTRARLRYTLLDRTWVQEFSFVRVTVDLLQREGAPHGLAVDQVHGEDETWVSLRPVAR